MNQKQSEDSILEAVSDAIGREWTIEEKQFIENNSELQIYLKEWLNNSLSDTCWHPDNYNLVQDLNTPSNFSPPTMLENEEIHIPF